MNKYVITDTYFWKFMKRLKTRTDLVEWAIAMHGMYESPFYVENASYF